MTATGLSGLDLVLIVGSERGKERGPEQHHRNAISYGWMDVRNAFIPSYQAWELGREG